MNLKIFYNDLFECHEVPQGHPERKERIQSVNKLIKENYPQLIKKIVPFDVDEYILKVHSISYLKLIKSISETTDILKLDNDTFVSRGTYNAAKLGVCGSILAVDHAMKKKNNSAFVCLRPPGHHAEPEKPMGFCIFSNAAIAAEYARFKYNLKCVAVLDFDVHHGNGTQACFENKKDLLYFSSHEMPLFPGTGNKHEIGQGNIFNFPLRPHSDGFEFLNAWSNHLLPKLFKLKPELVIISAGFDAHKDDPISSLNLTSHDFKKVTQDIMDYSIKFNNGKILSLLEGGYNLKSLSDSLNEHLCVLSGKK